MLWYYVRPHSTSQLAPDFKGMKRGIQFKEIGKAVTIGLGVFNDMLTPTVCLIFENIQGLMPVLGYSLGQNNQRRMAAATIKVTSWAVGYAILCSFGIWVFARPLVSLFSDDPVVIDQGVSICHILFTATWLQAFTQMVSLVTQAFHHIKTNMAITFVRPVLQIIFPFTLPYFMGVRGVWMGVLVGDAICGSVSATVLALYIRGMLKRAKEEGQAEETHDLESAVANKGEQEEETSHTASLDLDGLTV
ncbi:multi antimicrobial extrusion protein [Kipferlia bialata]|uniref:Multi antimicrobial extrusion protein n=1 Tax=Kipferlia bialata TaxID=797122 RepID=A0A9K3D3V9_9EUKA|nr:multi antimicrobial extrusion protein [Kipferlia bialata]|eukprot:g9396.t1